MSDSNHSCTSFFAGTAVGAILGALSVLFFTTKEGQRIQRVAKNKYHDLEETAEKIAQTPPKRNRSRRKPTEE
jgi:gas vesicle protein